MNDKEECDMAVRLVQRIVHLWALILVLVGCPGCRVFVQNRYAVFGWDSFETESVAHARAWSLAMLMGVAVIAAALGAVGFWLAPRLYRGWRQGLTADTGRREESGDSNG
jgi:hypothetical protein